MTGSKVAGSMVTGSEVAGFMMTGSKVAGSRLPDINTCSFLPCHALSNLACCLLSVSWSLVDYSQ